MWRWARAGVSWSSLCRAWELAAAEDRAERAVYPDDAWVRNVRDLPSYPLPIEVAAKWKALVGKGLEGVRLCAGAAVDTALRQVGVAACCFGQHVLVGSHALNSTDRAAPILLHELAHVGHGPCWDRVRCWDAADHASLSEAACVAYGTLLRPLARAVDVDWPDFIQGIRNASSNMDFRGRAAHPLDTLGYVFGLARGEGVRHGEAQNYAAGVSWTANAAMNIAEQNRHAHMAVGELLADHPLLTIGRYRIRARSHRSGSLGRTVGGVTVWEREWIKSLANAFHVAQDRASHREGTHGYGHDDPRCSRSPAWNPDRNVHEHSMGKGWDRCSAAAYKRALNNSFDVIEEFLRELQRRSTGATFAIPVATRMTTRCP